MQIKEDVAATKAVCRLARLFSDKSWTLTSTVRVSLRSERQKLRRKKNIGDT